MKILKMFVLALVAMFAIGIVTATAASAALPEILLLTGVKFPQECKGENKGKTELRSGAGVLEGKGLVVLCAFTSAMLGTADFHFSEVHLGETKCKTAGDALGTVLIKGEIHLVFTALSPTLTVAAQILVSEQTIECGLIKIKVRSTANGVLGNAISPKFGTETKEGIKFAFHCKALSKTENEPSEFENEKGENVKGPTGLESNFGVGFGKSCEEVEGETTVTPVVDYTLDG